MLYGLMSRSMRERSMLAWFLEIATHVAFYFGPWAFNLPELLHHIARVYFNGNYVSMFRTLLIASATLPWLVASAFYFTLYYKKIPFFEKYRIQDWVWDREDSPRKTQYMTLLKKTVANMIFRNVLSSAVVLYFIFPYVFDTTRDMVAYVDSLPTCWENFSKLMLGLFLFDMGFYWSHRLLHAWPRLYRYHKDHHAYYVPTALAGVWMHEIDDTITSLACGLIPAYLLNMNIITFSMWNITNICHSCYDHCGYHLPYDPMQLIPLGCHNDSHNAHHSLNRDNYGLYWRHWDVLMGTDALWLRCEREREEALALYKQLNDAMQTETAGAQPAPRVAAALKQLRGGARTLVVPDEDAEYRVLAADGKGVQALEHGGVVVRDGVAVMRGPAERAEMASGEDNLAFTYRTRITHEADKAKGE